MPGWLNPFGPALGWKPKGLKQTTLPGAQGTIIAYLLCHPGRQQRSELIRDTGLPSGTVRSALHRLQKGEGLDKARLLFVDKKTVELRVGTTTSALDFARDAVRGGAGKELEQAFRLVEQGFMTTLDTHGGGWLAEVRHEVAEMLGDLCDRALSQPKLTTREAQRWVARWTAADPYTQETGVRAAQALSNIGEPALALAELDKLATRLRELGLELDRAGQRLVTQLHIGRRGDRIPVRRHSLVPVDAPLVDRILVERDDQLAALRTALDNSLVARQTVFISGASGMGKTLLAWHACRAWVVEDAPSVTSGLGSASRGFPALLWAPFGQQQGYWSAFFLALARYAQQLDDDELRDQFGSTAVVVAEYLPDVAQRLGVTPNDPIGDPGGRRDRLFAAVAEIVRSICRTGPTVMVFDDLHHASRADRALLGHLLRATDLTPMAILITYQPRQALEDWLADVKADIANHTLIEVDSLSSAGVAELLGDATSGEVKRALSATGGQPFRVEHWRDTQQTSESIARALPTDVLDVVAACALVPRRVEISMLQRAFDDTQVESAVKTATGLGLLVRAHNTVTFPHDLVREDVLEAAEERLDRLASELSGTLEVTGVDTVARAHIAARTDDQAEAARLWRVAAEEANLALAFDDAAAHFERAQAFQHDPPVAAELLNALGLTLWQAGEFRRATQVFAQAVAVAQNAALAIPLAMGAVGLSGPLGFQGVTVNRDVVSALRAAIAMLVDADGLTHKALTYAALAQALTFAPPSEKAQAAKLAAEAEVIARAKLDDGDDEMGTGAWVLIEVLSRTSWTVWDPMDGLSRRRRADELVRLADTTRNPSVVAMHRLEARIQRIANAVEYGEIDQAITDIEMCRKLADQTRLRYYDALVTAMQGMIALLDGPAGEHPYTWDALEIGQRDQNQAIIQLFGAQLLYVRLLQGRSAELQAASQALSEYYRAIAGWRAGQALILALDGRAEEAAAHTRALIADDFAAVGRDMFYLVCLDHIARTAVLIADHLDAELLDTIYHRLEPHSGRNVIAGAAVAVHGPVDVALGLLAMQRGDGSLALTHFTAAETLARKSRCRPALVEIGTLMLLARGGTDAASLQDDLDRIDELVAEVVAMGLAGTAEQLADVIVLVRAQLAPSHQMSSDADARLEAATLALEPLRPQAPLRPPAWPRRRFGDIVAKDLLPRIGPRILRLADDELERLFRRQGAGLMRSLATFYRPDKGLGFSGEIGLRFELSDGDALEWHIAVDGRKATARGGPAANAKTTVITPVRPFVELLSNRLNGVQAWVEGDLNVNGDPTLAARLVEMFSGEQALVVLAED